jgi:hypothetical protein
LNGFTWLLMSGIRKRSFMGLNALTGSILANRPADGSLAKLMLPIGFGYGRSYKEQRKTMDIVAMVSSATWIAPPLEAAQNS